MRQFASRFDLAIYFEGFFVFCFFGAAMSRGARARYRRQCKWGIYSAMHHFLWHFAC